MGTVAAACPALARLSLNGFSLQGSWEGEVLPHLTRLELEYCEVDAQQPAAASGECEWEAWPGAPLLHAAAPRLAALETDYLCGPEVAAALLDRRLTALTHVHLESRILGSHDKSDERVRATESAFRKVERLAPASLGFHLFNESNCAPVEPALAWLKGCVVGWAARGALQSLAVCLFTVPVPVHMLLPALAPLGGTLRKLEVRGGVLGAPEDCALALHDLPEFTRLEVLTLKPSTDGVPDPQDVLGLTDAALRALVAPLPALRARAPALRRVSVQLPNRLTEGVSWPVIEELNDACPGLLCIEYGEHS